MQTPALQLALLPRRPTAPAAAIAGPTLTLVLTALLAAACFALAHRNGLWFTPDGWAYWEGAVSLADGRGYTYFSGHPIVAWPPLYSLYLATWTSLFGPTALSVGWATGVLVSLEAVAWVALGMRVAPVVRRPVAVGLVVVYVIAFLTLNQRQPLAHCMLYLFLPLQLMLLQGILQRPAPRLIDSVLLVLVSVLAALAHHVGLVFTLVLLAASLVVAPRRAAKLPVLGMAAALALGAWLIARILCGQSESHAMGLGQAADTPLTYLIQGLTGAAETFAPGPAGWVIFGVVIALTFFYRRDPGVRFAGVVVLLLFIASIALFSLVYVKDAFTGRFVHFVPLLLVPPLILRLAADSALRMVLFSALVLPVVIFFSTPVIVRPDTDDIPNAAVLSRDVPPGATIVRQSRILVGPIGWEEPAGAGPPRTASGR